MNNFAQLEKKYQTEKSKAVVSHWNNLSSDKKESFKLMVKRNAQERDDQDAAAAFYGIMALEMDEVGAQMDNTFRFDNFM